MTTMASNNPPVAMLWAADEPRKVLGVAEVQRWQLCTEGFSLKPTGIGLVAPKRDMKQGFSC